MKHQRFNVPRGIVFYPCCGSDTLEVLETFLNDMDVFMFCDTSNVALPKINDLSYQRPKGVLSLTELMPATFKKGVSLTNSYSEYWVTNTNEFLIDVYHLDATKVLEWIDEIAVFFYRGDSMSGLGSGIPWLGKDLFNCILDKLMDGGLIITDGSNPDPNQLDTPWKNLYAHSHWAFVDLEEDEVPKDFMYRNYQFKCVGSLSPRYGKTFVWKVCKSHTLT